MFLGYKSLQYTSSQNDYLEFSDYHLGKYDEETLKLMVRRVQFLIVSILNNTENYLDSEEYQKNVQELTELVYKVDFKDADQDDLNNFFNHLLKYSGENNYHNIGKKENLFISLVKLNLSFMSQSAESIIYEFINCGLLKYLNFLLSNAFPTRLDVDVYEALARIVGKSSRIQKEILNIIPIKGIDARVKSNKDNEKFLDAIFKFLCPFTMKDNNLNSDEIYWIMKAYMEGLKLGQPKIYPMISIGIYEKIKSVQSIKNYYNKFGFKLEQIFPLLVERMDQNEILCEYTFYISKILLNLEIKIDIDYPKFQSYLNCPSLKVQIASVYFFSSLAQNVDILKKQKLDVANFLWELHLVYQNASYVIKEYLDETIYFYLILDIYDKDKLFPILERGFTDTLVQIIQTQKKNLYNILIFVNKMFERSVRLQCIDQLSNQFMNCGGFSVLYDFFNDSEFISSDENVETLELLKIIIQDYEPKDDL